MTLYASIREINDRLTAASKQMIANVADPSKAVPVDDAAVKADVQARADLYIDVAKKFLSVYFDPSQVQDGEPVLVAMYRLIGGDKPYRRFKCGPVMDALVEYEIGFTEEGDLILMHGESIALACKALGFSSEVVPAWVVTTSKATGQMVLTKGDQVHG